MDRFTVLLFQGNGRLAQTLAESLSCYFLVAIVESLEELESTIQDSRPAVVVFDTEMASLDELAGLCRRYPGIRFICNHRLADEVMWTAALSVGAADVCASADAPSIRMSVLQNVPYPVAA
jgi:DNA-binding NtrC family response regulator